MPSGRRSWRQYVLHPSEAESTQRTPPPPTKTEPSNKQLRLQLSSKPVTTNSFRQQSLSFKVIITEKDENQTKSICDHKKSLCLKPYAKMQHLTQKCSQYKITLL